MAAVITLVGFLRFGSFPRRLLLSWGLLPLGLGFYFGLVLLLGDLVFLLCFFLLLFELERFQGIRLVVDEKRVAVLHADTVRILHDRCSGLALLNARMLEDKFRLLSLSFHALIQAIWPARSHEVFARTFSRTLYCTCAMRTPYGSRSRRDART